jgi:DNA-binding NarL/FixJ family response regulator
MDTPATVLIVEGHARVRDALVERLRHVPTVRVVQAAGDTDAALRLAATLVPAVALYDPRTVAGEPPAALRRLVESGCTVVVLTSSLLEDEAAMLQAAGATAVVLKGSRTNGLVAAIEAAWTQTRHGRESANECLQSR